MEEITVKKMLITIRDKKMFTNTNLANYLGVAKSQITKWLDGATPRFDMLKKIKAKYDEVIK